MIQLNYTVLSKLQTVGERWTLCRSFTFIAFVLAMLFISGCRKRSPPQDFSGSISTNQPLMVLKGHTHDRSITSSSAPMEPASLRLAETVMPR